MPFFVALALLAEALVTLNLSRRQTKDFLYLGRVILYNK